jgi:hypothetical protein
MADLLEDIKNEMGEAAAWAGTMSKYMEAARKKLEGVPLSKIKANADNLKDQAAKAKRLMATYVGRSEYRIRRHIDKLAEDLNKLYKDIEKGMPKEAEELKDIIQGVAIADDSLTAMTSRYAGEIKELFSEFQDAVKDLKVAMQLLEKAPGDKKRGAAVQSAERDVGVRLVKVKNELITDNKWALGLIASLKELQTFLAKIDAAVSA